MVAMVTTPRYLYWWRFTRDELAVNSSHTAKTAHLTVMNRSTDGHRHAGGLWCRLSENFSYLIWFPPPVTAGRWPSRGFYQRPSLCPKPSDRKSNKSGNTHLYILTERPALPNMEFWVSLSLSLSNSRELDHPNLCKFIGGCVEVPNVAIVTEYCPKGSLNDVLLNEEVPLNWGFR